MAAYAGKRAFDLLVVAVAAPLWVPALAITALCVRARLGTPVLFRQQRPGLGGRPFELIKFRTMRDAADHTGAPLPDAERLTPFGRRLRATSLDELPQLLNVLRGEMSLVGPRPLLMRYLPLYSERHRRRHDVPPGVTGLAQVSGRNALGWAERFELDVDYAERNSLGRDVRILWRTARAVLGQRGVSAAGEATMPAFTGYAPVSAPRAAPPAPAPDPQS